MYLDTAVYKLSNKKKKKKTLYSNFSHWIGRMEHLYVSFYTVIDVGLTWDARSYDDREV